MITISKFLNCLKTDTNYLDFWRDYHNLCKNFNVDDKEEFIELLPLLLNKMDGDLAVYRIHQSLREYAKKDPNSAIEILNILNSQKTIELLEFKSSILSGLSRSSTKYPFEKEILSLLNSIKDEEVYCGINSANYSAISDPKSELVFLSKVHNSISRIIKREPENCMGLIARFYISNLKKIDSSKKMLIELLNCKKIEIQNEIVRSLNDEITINDDFSFFQECLNLLSFMDPKYTSVYNSLEYQLKDIIQSSPEIIFQFIKVWISNNSNRLNRISVLKNIFIKLYTGHKEKTCSLFLSWLNSENKNYKNGLRFIVSDFEDEIDDISFPNKDLEFLNENDSLYVCFMITGYIFDYKNASHMLYSVLETKYKNARIRNHIASLFVQYWIKNYYSSTSILKEKREGANKIIKSIIDQIIDSSEEYYKCMKELKPLNEFEPSEERLNYFYKQQSIRISKLMSNDKSRNHSFLDMATNIEIKAGKTFFSKHNGEYSQESQMQNFKSSFELPRMESIDETGQMKFRLMMQNINRNELPD